MSYNLTGVTVSESYSRLVQVVYGTPNQYYDGFGNLLDLGSGTYSIGTQGPIGATGATGSNGVSIIWQGEWDEYQRYFYYDTITYFGSLYICIDSLGGSAPWQSPELDITHWSKMIIGVTGSSGIDGSSGTSGIDGSSGTSGIDGSSGTSGIDGSSGTSGIDGSSGTSGIDGSSGTSGIEGSSGTSGIDGSSGTSGIDGSGTSGIDGSSGTSGIDGSSGTSGIDGTSGSSGSSGISGSSGSSGSSGNSGTSGSSGSSGTSGIQGPQGPQGQSSNLFYYKGNTASISGNPGAGYISWNNFGQTNSTSINVNMLTDDGTDIDIYLSFILTNQNIIIQDRNVSENYQKWRVTGTTSQIIGVSNYWTIPVTLTDSSGTGTTNFLDNHELFLGIFSFSGTSGSSGSSGTSGSSGSSGTSGTSGLLSLTGNTDNGLITLNGSTPNATVESNITFDGSRLNINGNLNAIVATFSNIYVTSGNLTYNGTTLLIKSDSISQTMIIASGSSTNDLVRITQTGTGNSFVVEDSTNPDNTPFVIDNNGNVIIGTSSVTSGVILDINGNTRISDKIIGNDINNQMKSDTLIQAGLLFLSNNC